MVADAIDVVVGVDTHRDSHTLALVDARSSALLGQAQLPATAAGYRRALQLARRAGSRRAWAIEGSGAYGAGLARFLASQGERVHELERPIRARGRNGRLKDDSLDALRGARSLLADQPAGQPRQPGPREALRVLLLSREAAVAERRRGLNQLRSLVVTAPESLRQRLTRQPKNKLVTACLRLRTAATSTPEQYATTLALRSCARRVQLATNEAASLERELRHLIERDHRWLLTLRGVGPISAAQLLVAWSHPRRLHSEAAFARLAGAAPIPASSGQRTRHRLDRGGDRKLNRALHQIIISRRKHDPETIAYIQRRTAEGKTLRDTTRSLKRYLARSLYRALENTAPLAT